MNIGRSFPRTGGAARFALAVVLAAAVAAPFCWSPATAAPEVPRGSLGLPDDEGTVFLVGFGGAGAAFSGGGLRPGGGGELVFRPHAAADIYRPLFDWNTAFVLQGEIRSIDDRRSLGCLDVILRRYGADMRRGDRGSAPFLGIGIGVGRGKLPVTVVTTDGEGEGATSATRIETTARRDLTYLAEAGWEWSPAAGMIMIVKAQLRYFDGKGMDYTNAALSWGVGVPVPW